jgi:transposase-like protein
MKAANTLQQAIQFFSDYDNCREFMVAVRWADGVVRCPQCDSQKVTYLANAKLYKCSEKHARQKFSLKVGTIFEDSPLPLEKWLPAVWLIVSAKNGISSYEVHRALGVTQKSAWFMMHRVRLAMQSGSFKKAGGDGAEVEVDETFIGGKARNMHKSVRAKKITGTGGKGKTIVFGVLERGGKVHTQVVDNRLAKTVRPILKERVVAGAKLYTDVMLG